MIGLGFKHNRIWSTGTSRYYDVRKQFEDGVTLENDQGLIRFFSWYQVQSNLRKETWTVKESESYKNNRRIGNNRKAPDKYEVHELPANWMDLALEAVLTFVSINAGQPIPDRISSLSNRLLKEINKANEKPNSNDVSSIDGYSV